LILETYLLIVTLQVVSQFRVYIIYGRQRLILVVNSLLFVLELVSAVVITAVLFRKNTPIPTPSSFTGGSCFENMLTETSVVWIPRNVACHMRTLVALLTIYF